jgi:GR25 family glycosyltransferase involved in LPS biosynthesis
MILNNTLNFSFDSKIESAYIIYLPNNIISKKHSQKCVDSCKKFNIPFKLHEGFDGTDKKTIKVPKNLEKQSWIKWIKILNQHLKITEVCCFLSHLSLWIKCIEIDKPIIILEHDAIMIKPYFNHLIQNCIIYFGSKFQIEKQNKNMIYGQLNQNYRFMYCAHAYSIDPQIAKNLVSSVIKTGITHSLDAYIRSDYFTIHQTDIYAFDDNMNETTIHDCENLMYKNYIN